VSGGGLVSHFLLGCCCACPGGGRSRSSCGGRSRAIKLAAASGASVGIVEVLDVGSRLATALAGWWARIAAGGGDWGSSAGLSGGRSRSSSSGRGWGSGGGWSRSSSGGRGVGGDDITCTTARAVLASVGISEGVHNSSGLAAADTRRAAAWDVGGGGGNDCAGSGRSVGASGARSCGGGRAVSGGDRRTSSVGGGEGSRGSCDRVGGHWVRGAGLIALVLVQLAVDTAEERRGGTGTAHGTASGGGDLALVEAVLTGLKGGIVGGGGSDGGHNLLSGGGLFLGGGLNGGGAWNTVKTDGIGGHKTVLASTLSADLNVFGLLALEAVLAEELPLVVDAISVNGDLCLVDHELVKTILVLHSDGDTLRVDVLATVGDVDVVDTASQELGVEANVVATTVAEVVVDEGIATVSKARGRETP